jgi:hypothetical protein
MYSPIGGRAYRVANRPPLPKKRCRRRFGFGAGGVSGSVSMSVLGSRAAHNNVQPTIVCNYIMRVLQMVQGRR